MNFSIFFFLTTSAKFFDLDLQTYSKLTRKGKGQILLLHYSHSSLQIYQNFKILSQQYPDIHYATINCQAYPQACISQTPPSIQYRQDSKQYPYFYKSTFQDLKWFSKKIKSLVLSVDSRQTFSLFSKTFPYSFILFTDSSNPQQYQRGGSIYASIAKKFRFTPLVFGRAKFDQTWRDQRINPKNLPMVRQYGYDQAYSFNSTNFNEAILQSFVEDHFLSMAFQLTESTWKMCQYFLKGKVIVISVVDTKNQTQRNQYVNHLRSITWDYRKRGKLNLLTAYIDINEDLWLAEQFQVFKAPFLMYQKIEEDIKSPLWLHGLSPMRKKELLEELKNIREKSHINETYYIPQQKPENPSISVEHIVIFFYPIFLAILSIILFKNKK